MKVTNVEITTSTSSDVLRLNFGPIADDDPYSIREIVGLDVDDLTRQQYSGFDEVQLSEVYLLKRDIVVLVDLNPRSYLNETYSQLRDQLYKMLWADRRGLVSLLFCDSDEDLAAISGIITKFETQQFSRTQSVKLTIKCEEPLLKAPEDTVVDVSGFTSLNLSVTDHKSTAPHGFEFQLKMLKKTNSILLGSPGQFAEDEPIGLLVSGASINGFQIDDMIYGSSELGNRYLYVMRDSVKTPLIDMIQFNSSWPMMFPGENRFFLQNPEDDVKIVAKWLSLKYYATYWGV